MLEGGREEEAVHQEGASKRPSGVADLGLDTVKAALLFGGGLPHDDRPLSAPGRIRPQVVRRKSKRAKVSRVLTGGLPGKLEELSCCRHSVRDLLEKKLRGGFGRHTSVGKMLDALPDILFVEPESGGPEGDNGDGRTKQAGAPNAATLLAEKNRISAEIERGLADLPRGRLKDALRELAAWPGKIEVVDLSTTDLSKPQYVQKLLEYVIRNGAVQRVLLAHCRISTAGMLAIASAMAEQRLGKLLDLDLRHNTIHPDAGKTMRSALMLSKGLRRLGLGATWVPLAELRSGQREQLRLRQALLGSGECVVLSAAVEFAPRLRDLNISANAIVPRRKPKKYATARLAAEAEMALAEAEAAAAEPGAQLAVAPALPPEPAYDMAGIDAIALALARSRSVHFATIGGRCVLPVRKLKGLREQQGEAEDESADGAAECLSFRRAGLRFADEIVLGKLLERGTDERATKTALAVVDATEHAQHGPLSVDLANNQLAGHGARALARALRTNASLLVLGLACNKLGPVGLRQLVAGLVGPDPVALTSLDLSCNQLGDCASTAEVLGRLLECNSTLTDLSVRGNALGKRGTCRLLDALAARTEDCDDVNVHSGPRGGNCTLTSLDFTDNNAGDAAAGALARALQVRVLAWLRFSGNAISNKGKETIGNALLEMGAVGPCGCSLECDEWVLPGGVRQLALVGRSLCSSDLVLLSGALSCSASLEALDLSRNELCDMAVSEVTYADRAASRFGIGTGAAFSVGGAPPSASNGTAFGLYRAAGVDALVRSVPASLGLTLLHLRLDDCGLGHGGLAAALGIAAAVAPSAAPRLISLSLAANLIGPCAANGHDSAAIVALARSIHLHRRLARLELGANALGDVGISHVAAAIAAHPTMRYVGLAANGISAQGLRVLARALIQHSAANFESSEEEELDAKLEAGLASQADTEDSDAEAAASWRGGRGSRLGVVDVSENDIDSSGGSAILSFISGRCGFHAARRRGPRSGSLGLPGSGSGPGSGFSDPASHVLVLRGRGWCAVLLQTAYRRWRHRAAYIALIRLRNFRATRLAAAWRRYAALRALPQRRAEHRERELRRAAMIAIQCAARLFCASREMERRRKVYAEFVASLCERVRSKAGGGEVSNWRARRRSSINAGVGTDLSHGGGLEGARQRQKHAKRLLQERSAVLGAAVTAAARLQAAGAGAASTTRAAMAAAAAAALETGIDAAAAATQAAEMIGVLGLLQHEAGGADGAAGKPLGEDMRKKLVKEAAITAARVVFESGGSAAECAAAAAAAAKALGGTSEDVVSVAALAAATATLGGFDIDGIASEDVEARMAMVDSELAAQAGAAAAAAAAAAGASDEVAARAAVSAAAEAVLAVHGLSADSDSSGLATSGSAMLASDEARRAVLRAAGAAAASAAHALVGPQGGLLELPGFGTKAVARLAAEAAAGGAMAAGLREAADAGAIAGSAAESAGASVSDVARLAGAAAADAAIASGGTVAATAQAAARAAATAMLAAGGTADEAAVAAEHAAGAAVMRAHAAEEVSKGAAAGGRRPSAAAAAARVAAMVASFQKAARADALALASSQVGAELKQEHLRRGQPTRRVYAYVEQRKAQAQEKADREAEAVAEYRERQKAEQELSESAAAAHRAVAHAGGVGSGRVVHGIEPHANNVRGLQSTRPDMFSRARQEQLLRGPDGGGSTESTLEHHFMRQRRATDVRTSLVLLS